MASFFLVDVNNTLNRTQNYVGKESASSEYSRDSKTDEAVGLQPLQDARPKQHYLRGEYRKAELTCGYTSCNSQ